MAERMEDNPLHLAVRDALVDEFLEWVSEHPKAGMFDWNVAADNALAALNLDDLEAAVERGATALARYAGEGDKVPLYRTRASIALEAALTPKEAVDG